jgi:hypothetical protein|tara:strand:+ start:461 stop:889 length:429 start_codon:yes stop_codon:yes gene_type:complete
MTRVTFTNNFKTTVLDNVQKLIKQTIPGIPLFYDKHKGQESFLLRPVSDDFIEYGSNAHVRLYTIELSFEIESGTDFTRDKDILRLTDVAELVKRIFFDNRNLIDAWYNASVTNVVYQRDEEDAEKERFILTLECNVNEVIS